MPKIAIKKLTRSDLGFFEPMFRKITASNQKAINLNADVFVDQFYSALSPGGIRGDQEIPVRLVVFGPDGAERELLARTITRSAQSKNWRLDGEFVYNPDGQLGRFNHLQVGDLAVLEFRGDPEPDRVNLLLVSAGASQDAALHGHLAQLFATTNKSMIAVEPGQLSQVVASVPRDHPIWQFAEDDETKADLQDAAVGGAKGEARLARRGVRVSPEA